MTTTVQEIEAVVSQFTSEELASFRTWFAEFDAQRWDQQLAADMADGQLDALADEALSDYRAGRARPL